MPRRVPAAVAQHSIHNGMPIHKRKGPESAGALAHGAALEPRQAAVLLHHSHAQLLALLVEGAQGAGGANLDAPIAEIAVALVEIEHRRAGPQEPIAHRSHGDGAGGARAAATVALQAGRRQVPLILAARRPQKLPFAGEGHADPADAGASSAGDGKAHEAAAGEGAHDAASPSAAHDGRTSSTASPKSKSSAISAKNALSDST